MNVPDEQIEAHARDHDEAQALRTDVCVDCGKPVDQGCWTIFTKEGLQSQTNKFDRDSRGLGRYVLVPKPEGVPYARSVTFEGTHNLHVCMALVRQEQEAMRPSEPWVTEDDLVDELFGEDALEQRSRRRSNGLPMNRRPCPFCSGTGKARHTRDGLCPSCDGSGRRPRFVDYSDNWPPLGGEAA